MNDIEQKMEKVIELLKVKNEEQEVEKNMKNRIKKDLDRKLKETVIRRKMGELKRELGENEEEEEDEDGLIKKYEEKKQWIPDKV